MNTTKSKIKSLLKLSKDVITKYENELGPHHNSRYDKTEFGFGIEPAVHNLHNVIYFRHHSGVYGNSNVSSVFPDDFAKYVSRAINEQKERIIYRASELMVEEAKKLIEELKCERDNIESLIIELEEEPHD